jgi:XTP/dITP diphosphohydrolase
LKILLATTNPHKIQEIKKIIPENEFLCILDFNAGWRIEETGVTFEENSLVKAKEAAHYFGIAAIGDDSGLEIAVLDNFPGIQSARFLEGFPYIEKMSALLEKLSPYRDPEERYARFRTVASFYDPLTGTQLTTEGIVEGSIAMEIKGSGGFGYDPIFIPKGFDQTFGELTDTIKNSFSHRARAFKSLFERIKTDIWI